MNLRAPDGHTVVDAIPVLAVAVALLALIFHAIPADNEDSIKLVLAGLLGFLSRQPPKATATASNDDGTATTTTGGAPDPQQLPQQGQPQ